MRASLAIGVQPVAGCEVEGLLRALFLSQVAGLGPLSG